MAFKHIFNRTSRADEQIILMELGHSHEKDELGFPKEEYIPIQELKGIIQAPQDLDIDFNGQESEPRYVGYFMPEFSIEAERLNDYRIEYRRPYETMVMKITEYNPNLFLRHNRHHVKLRLKLEKKYVRAS